MWCEKFNKIMLFLLLFLSKEISSQPRENWIHPHEITSTVSGTFTKNDEQCSCMECPNINIDEKLTLAYYKRFINLILNEVFPDSDNVKNYKGRLDIQMSTEAYDYLKNFSKKSKFNSESLRRVDGYLSESLKKAIHEHVYESVVSWTDRLYFNFYNRTTGVLMALLFMSIISYKLLRANLNLWTVFLYLVFIGWIVDFGFTWLKLLQEAEIIKMADSLRYNGVPPNCDPSKMSWFAYLWSTLSSSSDCREYHKTMYSDIFWSIAPLQVFSHQCGIIILTPAGHIGKALGVFSSALLDHLPFYSKIIVFPLLIIFSAIILCIVLSFLTKTSFSFNIFHLFQVEFGKTQREMIADSLSGNNLSQLLSIANRETSKVETVVQQCINCANNQLLVLRDSLNYPSTPKNDLNENGNEVRPVEKEVPNKQIRSNRVEVLQENSVSNSSDKAHSGGEVGKNEPNNFSLEESKGHRKQVEDVCCSQSDIEGKTEENKYDIPNNGSGDAT